MGCGGSQLIQDLQVVPIMDSYDDLKNTLFLYEAQQISNGTDAVLKAHKHSMYKIKSMLNANLMKTWGFEADSSATVKRVDEGLLINYLQTNVDSNAQAIVLSGIGLPSIDELAQVALQAQYSGYSADIGTFINPIDGYMYIYDYATEAGNGLLDIVSFMKPNITASTALYSSTYDTITNLTVEPTLVETSPGIFEVSTSFNYVEYTITTAVDGVVSSAYTTTIIGGVTDSSVTTEVTDPDTGAVISSSTTTVTVTQAIKYTTEYSKPVYLYLQAPDITYSFLNDLSINFGGVTNEQVNGWYKDYYDIQHNKITVIGVGDLPTDTFGHTTTIIGGNISTTITYTTNRAITKVNDAEVKVTSTITNVSFTRYPNVGVPVSESISTPEAIQTIKEYDEGLIYKEIESTLETSYNSIITKYEKNGHDYIAIVNSSDAAQLLKEVPLTTMPIFNLKTGGALSPNPKVKLALKELGIIGDEFNDSIADTKIKYAALGFMFDVNNSRDPNDPTKDNAVTTRLMYDTFRYLDSEGILVALNNGQVTSTSGSGFNMKYEALTVTVQANFTITTVPGSIGSVGTYDSEVTEYTELVVSGSSHGSPLYSNVPMVRRIYRKQETLTSYVEINISDLLISHAYLGTSTNKVRSTVFGHSIPQGNRLEVGRMPILREVMRKLPYNYYLEALQSSLVLVVFSAYVVTTKWYQSGFFKFVMVAVAIASFNYELLALDTAIAAANATTMSITLAAVGAVATGSAVILSVAGMAGIDLGVFGEILQIVSIVTGTVLVANSAMNYIYSIDNAAAVDSVALSTTSKQCLVSANIARDIPGGLTLSNEYAGISANLTELSSQFEIASNGAVATGIDTVTSQTSANIISQLETIGSGSLPEVVIPTVEKGIVDSVTAYLEDTGILQGIDVVNKAVNIVSKVKGIVDTHKLAGLRSAMNDLKTLQNETENLLKEQQNSRHQALWMAPKEIEIMADTTTSVGSEFDDFYNSIENSISVTVSNTL